MSLLGVWLHPCHSPSLTLHRSRCRIQTQMLLYLGSPLGDGREGLGLSPLRPKKGGEGMGRERGYRREDKLLGYEPLVVRIPSRLFGAGQESEQVETRPLRAKPQKPKGMRVCVSVYEFVRAHTLVPLVSSVCVWNLCPSLSLSLFLCPHPSPPLKPSPSPFPLLPSLPPHRRRGLPINSRPLSATSCLVAA